MHKTTITLPSGITIVEEYDTPSPKAAPVTGVSAHKAAAPKAAKKAAKPAAAKAAKASKPAKARKERTDGFGMTVNGVFLPVKAEQQTPEGLRTYRKGLLTGSPKAVALDAYLSTLPKAAPKGKKATPRAKAIATAKADEAKAILAGKDTGSDVLVNPEDIRRAKRAAKAAAVKAAK